MLYYTLVKMMMRGGEGGWGGGRKGRGELQAAVQAVPTVLLSMLQFVAAMSC